jgi:ABC-type transport system involved in multi-copper enzyme maturation permease subunit
MQMVLEGSVRELAQQVLGGGYRIQIEADQLQGAVFGAPLPLDQSLALIWPHLTGLIAATILLFAVGYVLFQRQEIRA